MKPDCLEFYAIPQRSLKRIEDCHSVRRRERTEGTEKEKERKGYVLYAWCVTHRYCQTHSCLLICIFVLLDVSDAHCCQIQMLLLSAGSLLYCTPLNPSVGGPAAGKSALGKERDGRGRSRSKPVDAWRRRDILVTDLTSFRCLHSLVEGTGQAAEPPRRGPFSYNSSSSIQVLLRHLVTRLILADLAYLGYRHSVSHNSADLTMHIVHWNSRCSCVLDDKFLFVSCISFGD